MAAGIGSARRGPQTERLTSRKLGKSVRRAIAAPLAVAAVAVVAVGEPPASDMQIVSVPVSSIDAEGVVLTEAYEVDGMVFAVAGDQLALAAPAGTAIRQRVVPMSSMTWGGELRLIPVPESEDGVGSRWTDDDVYAVVDRVDAGVTLRDALVEVEKTLPDLLLANTTTERRLTPICGGLTGIPVQNAGCNTPRQGELDANGGRWRPDSFNARGDADEGYRLRMLGWENTFSSAVVTADPPQPMQIGDCKSRTITRSTSSESGATIGGVGVKHSAGYSLSETQTICPETLVPETPAHAHKVRWLGTVKASQQRWLMGLDDTYTPKGERRDQQYFMYAGWDAQPPSNVQKWLDMLSDTEVGDFRFPPV